MEVKRIKPSNESLIIRDPQSKKILAKEGELKTMTVFWSRRLLDGSVVIVEEKKEEIKSTVASKGKDEK